MTLSYLGFHLLFVLPPIAVLGVAVARRSRYPARHVVAGIGLLAVLATVYATPWDNYLIVRGVWSYGAGTVLARLPHTPVGEYLFFVFQPIITGLWFYLIAPRVVADVGTDPFPTRPVGVGLWFAVALVGGALVSTADGYYLGAILLWAAPIVALQWGFGGPCLWRYRRLQLLAIGVPTLYLWTVDSIAIHEGIWIISDTYTTGLAPLGLPIEEAVFFVVTNVLVVHGILLFEWVLARITVGGVDHGIEGLAGERVATRVTRWR